MALSRKISVFAALTFFALPAEAYEPQITLDAELRHESNVGNAGSQNVLEDWVASVGGNISQGILLDEHSGLLLRADLRYDEYGNYQDLSHMMLKAAAKYRVQLTSGFTEPWLEVRASVELLKHRGSSIRDGVILGLETSLGKYFTDRIQASVGAGLEQRQADEGRTFDIFRSKLFATLNYRIGDSAKLYINATRMFGDQVSTATPPSYLYGKAKAIDDDAALSEGVLRKAYRIGARTDVAELGVNFPLNGMSALDFGAQYARSQIDGGHIYDGYVFRAGYIYQFR